MNADETTRIEFARRQGYENVRYDWVNASDSIKDFIHDYCGKAMTGVPDPTDRNHVHAALMGMSEEEWWGFCWELSNRIGYNWANIANHMIVKNILQTPLSTLVSCYLEATKGRLKQSPAPSTSAQS